MAAKLDGEFHPLAYYDYCVCPSDVWPIINRVIGGDGLAGLNGLSGNDCLPTFEAAITEIEAQLLSDDRCDYEGALRVLRHLLAWCEDVPSAYLRVT